MSITKTSESLVLVSKQSGVVIIPTASPLTRLNYFDGKFLRASDLKAEQDYLRQLVRQSNQAGGSGVAHGFDLTLGGGDTLNIGAGLAIDTDGRVLLLPQGTSVGVQELIDKSQDLQRLFGKTSVIRADGFETCEMTSATTPVNNPQPSDLYLIVISPAEALCGEEDVFGKLCEEACATSTDRPLVVEGLIVRAIPLMLQTPLPASKAVALTQLHLRSRVASAYFEDERKRVASLISKSGLEQETWCLGADAEGGSGVPVGVIARAGSTTVFLDPWIARRERIDIPARRYWQWRMMMRPWDVFLAQVLQFQCQLHDLFHKIPAPGGDVDPCSGARGALNEAATTIAELRHFYEATTRRFTALNVNLEEAMTFKGGLSRLSDLNDKLVIVGQALSDLPQNLMLIRGGIIELPSAGYLPVVPGATATINQQVRRMMGEGVDLRFCVVRPDYVAHALEEAQHMERISLLQGLSDPTGKPQVDILVPNGEILEQQRLSPGNGFDASVDVIPNLLAASTRESQGASLNFRGAARTAAQASGGGAVYLSCEYQLNPFSALADELHFSSSGLAPTVNTPSVENPGLRVNLTRPGEATVAIPVIKISLWASLSCERNVSELKLGDTTNFNARTIIAREGTKVPLLDVEFNGVFQVTAEAQTTGKIQTLKGHIENARLSFAGTAFGNPGPRKTSFVDLNVTVTLTGGSHAEILLDHVENDLVLLADWGKQPLEMSASIVSKSFANALSPAKDIPLAQALLKENADVLSAKNASHIQALAALEFVAAALNDATFADAKARLLFPPPPKPTDELLVRGTMDWVLFQRRRTRQCSEEKLAPPAPTSRRYQLLEALAKNVDDAQSLKNLIFAGKIPADRLKEVTIVEFGGGVATLLTRPDDLLADWKVVKPGNIIIYGAIANHESAAADSDTLARTRLDRIEDALASVSKLSPQAVDDLLTKVPDSTPATGLDGAIFIVTLNKIETTCHVVQRVNPGQMERVLAAVKNGEVATAIGQFTQQVGTVVFNAGTDEAVDDSLQKLSAKWKEMGGGKMSQVAVTTFAEDKTVPSAIAVSQARTIERELDPAGVGAPLPISHPSPKPFPANVACPVITFMATQITRTALVIFGSLDGSTHFLSTPDPKHATVPFDDNVPRGDALTDLIKSLTPNEPVLSVMLAPVTTADAGATARATAAANTVTTVQNRPAGSVLSRTGTLTEGDKEQLTKAGISLSGFDDVIYLEPRPPRQ